MDGIQAAVLGVKLPHLDGWLDARRKNTAIYDELLADSGLTLPTAPDHSTHTYHLYVIQVPDRDDVQAKLSAAEIESGLHYPTPIPLMEAYEDLGYSRDDFPVAVSQMDRILSLPMYAELTREQIEHVSSTLKAAVSKSSAAAE
jgi:dTDP-4-amino-4,6-dideoxygalactose transaminase